MAVRAVVEDKERQAMTSGAFDAAKAPLKVRAVFNGLKLELKKAVVNRV